MELGFDGNTSIESSGGKYINITPITAVSKGRFIKELEYDDEGDYLTVTVENTEGSIANKRYYAPKMGGYVKSEEDLHKALSKVIKVVANIVRLYCPADIAIKGTTFKELCLNSIAAIKGANPDFAKKELWVKLVYNNNDFITLPSYSPIAAPGTLSEDEVKNMGLIVRAEYDTVVKTPVAPDPEPVAGAADPLSGPATTSGPGF